MDGKKFVGVKFIRSKETAVVPKSWLQKGKKFWRCKWPDEKDSDLIELSRAGGPPHENWPTFHSTF